MDAKMKELLSKLECLQTLAQANFPRATEIRLETTGLDPKASMTLPAWFVSKLCKAMREAQVKAEAETV